MGLEDHHLMMTNNRFSKQNKKEVIHAYSLYHELGHHTGN